MFKLEDVTILVAEDKKVNQAKSLPSRTYILNVER